MSRKHALGLLFAFLLLTVAGILLVWKDSASRTKGNPDGDTAFLGDFDVNSVSKIKIISSEKPLTLLDRNGKWAIQEKNNYPADFEQISSFVQTIRNIKPARELEYGKEYWGKFNLLKPSIQNGGGVLVELLDKEGRLLSSFIVGKMHFTKEKNPNPYMKTSYPDGRYVLANSPEAQPALIPDPMEAATPEPIVWMDKNIFSMGPIQSISSYGPKGRLIWTLARKSPKAPLDFPEGKLKTDQNTVKQFAELLHKIPFIDVLPLDRSVNPLINNLGVIKVKTFDGILYEIKIGVKRNRYYLKFDASPIDGKAASAEKLKREKFYSDWIYETTPKLAEVFLFRKDAFLKKK